MSRRKALSPSTRFLVWRRDGFRCTYCGVTAEDPGVVLEVDHILAVAHGGTDALENLTTACKPCNFRKGPRPVFARRVKVKKVRSVRVRVERVKVRQPRVKAAAQSKKERWAPDPRVTVQIRNRTKIARRKQGMTQTALAQLSGVSRMTLHKIERDDGYAPEAASLLALAVALNDERLFWMERTGDEEPIS